MSNASAVISSVAIEIKESSTLSSGAGELTEHNAQNMPI
jgi:hypothetical protein